MTSRRVSSEGKLIGGFVALWAVIVGGSVALHEYVVDPAPPQTNMQRLQSEFTDAVAKRAGEIEGEKRDAVIVEKLCTETAATLTQTFQSAGIAATFTAPYQSARPGYPLGSCVLYVNDGYLTTIDAPDEFESEYNREYLNEQLMKKLSPGALQRLEQRLPGAINGLKN